MYNIIIIHVMKRYDIKFCYEKQFTHSFGTFLIKPLLIWHIFKLWDNASLIIQRWHPDYITLLERKLSQETIEITKKKLKH